MNAPNPIAPPLGAWWKRFDRESVLGAIEDASGRALDHNDPLPDTLIANAEALGLLPMHLRMWIYDEPKRDDWTADSLRAFARRYSFGTPEVIEDGEKEKAAPPAEGTE